MYVQYTEASEFLGVIIYMEKMVKYAYLEGLFIKSKLSNYSSNE